MSTSPTASPFRQPKAVWAVAFACVISFMGIGLVDPILPALAQQLAATPAQVSLLFTSYLLITAVAMLVTGWVSSRIGAKATLVTGLSIIVVFAALAGASGSIGEIVGFRAGWGLGNALFIATSLAVIVASASGGFAGAIILYETALGVGIALGPLVGGLLGSVSWRAPFFGVAVLMAIALIATLVLLDKTPKPATKIGLLDPIRALRHRSLATIAVTAFAYNWGFFTLLAYSPYSMGDLSELGLGAVFTAWGVLVAIFAVFVAPALERRFGTVRVLYYVLGLLAVDLLVIAVWNDTPGVVIGAVIVAGAMIGLNNTLVTQAVMSVAPVERPVASASYSFVRFLGGGLAPWIAGLLAEAFLPNTPFWVGAVVVAVGILVLSTAHRLLRAVETGEESGRPTTPSPTPASARSSSPSTAPRRARRSPRRAGGSRSCWTRRWSSSTCPSGRSSTTRRPTTVPAVPSTGPSPPPARPVAPVPRSPPRRSRRWGPTTTWVASWSRSPAVTTPGRSSSAVRAAGRSRRWPPRAPTGCCGPAGPAPSWSCPTGASPRNRRCRANRRCPPRADPRTHERARSTVCRWTGPVRVRVSCLRQGCPGARTGWAAPGGSRSAAGAAAAWGRPGDPGPRRR